jgi:hypothetical protein
VKLCDQSALGLVYALNDMFLCIGFALGPVVGSVVQGALGNGRNVIIMHNCFLVMMIMSTYLCRSFSSN